MLAEVGAYPDSLSLDRSFIPGGSLGKALNDPPVDYWHIADPGTRRTYPMPGHSEVHFWWSTSGSWTGSKNMGSWCQSGFQQPVLECIVYSQIFLEDTSVFADIILPVVNANEMPDIRGGSDRCGNVLTVQPGVRPVGEAKSDIGAVFAVAEKLGFLDKINPDGLSEEEYIAKNVKEAFDNSKVTDEISWEEITASGGVWFSPRAGEQRIRGTIEKFYNDPVANPLTTPSGKIEFESQQLLDWHPDDKERPPVPHYIRGGPYAEGWAHNDDLLLSERAKDYPLLMTSNTSNYKHHSMGQDIPWTREVEKIVGRDGYAYEPIWIHPDTAATRGIEHGDIVRVYNDRGGVLGGAYITQRIRRDAVAMQKAGAGHHIIPGLGGLHEGNSNFINADNISTRAHGISGTGYLVNVERVTGAMMDEWRKNYPEAFERRKYYNPAYGYSFDAWVEGGE